MKKFGLFLVFLALAACGGGSGGGTVGAPGRLTVEPAGLVLNPGDTQGFRALDGAGNEVAVSWSLEGGPAGALDAKGLFTAPQSPGSFQVRASTAGNAATGAASVSVVGTPITTPSKLGIWLWRLERIGVARSHAELATRLKAMGVRRIFVKIADGSQQNSRAIGLPLDDPALPQAYRAQGLEVWAWSYNYPGASSYHQDQAGALLLAAKNGFNGFVVDVETEFESAVPSQITDFFTAFSSARDEAVRQGLILSRAAFPFFCTTFGNVGSDLPTGQRHPKGGHFTQAQLQAMDAIVDGWMPQTYLEAWNQVKAPALFVAEGNRVYRACGLVKPLWHITQTEEGEATAGDIDGFLLEAWKASSADGLNSSLWSIPNAGQTDAKGQRVDERIWDTQNRVNWRIFNPK